MHKLMPLEGREPAAYEVAPRHTPQVERKILRRGFVVNEVLHRMMLLRGSKQGVDRDEKVALCNVAQGLDPTIERDLLGDVLY